MLQILQDCPEEPEAINDEEQFDEIEAVGKSLLDRLTVPVVYPDGYGACSYNFTKGPVHEIPALTGGGMAGQGEGA